MSLNDDLINSAVNFLKDASISSAPLAKKIEFLESKGLNQVEIEESLKRANGAASEVSKVPAEAPQRTNIAAPVLPASVNDYYNPPPLPERDWKDLFIMATTTVGVTYGIYQIVTKYVIPHIIPPSKPSIEQDKESINDQFVKIDAVLEQMSKEQEEMKASNESRIERVDKLIGEVSQFLDENKDSKEKFESDLKLIKLEIDQVKNNINTTLDKQKTVINDELLSVSKELQSLKQLISSRSQDKRLPSISSIPSASEVLRQNLNGQAQNHQEAKSTGNSSSTGIPTWQQDKKDSKSDVGIPSWQQTSPPIEGTKSEAGIPSWQQTSPSTGGSKSESGIPAWQQSSSTSFDSPSWQKASTAESESTAEVDNSINAK